MDATDRTPSPIVQLTHHDLDGNGACTVAGCLADVGRVVHVPRYPDVAATLEIEERRLRKQTDPGILLLTDLSLEAEAIRFVKRFAAENRRRSPENRHRLVVLDHHRSTIDHFAAQGLPLDGKDGPRTLSDPEAGLRIVVDETRCATRLVLEERALFDGREPEAGLARDLGILAGAIDAYDIWRKDDPAFGGGMALNELFWDTVDTWVPRGHRWHEKFVGDLLLAGAALMREGSRPADIEVRGAQERRRIAEKLVAGGPGDDEAQTTRTRLCQAVSRSEDLFATLSDGTKICFSVDGGIFQLAADLIMERGEAVRVINVMRSGGISFRSRDGSALDGARKFRGGGHADAAGGRLQEGGAVSLTDAIAKIEPVLNPPPPDPSTSPFAKLAALRG